MVGSLRKTAEGGTLHSVSSGIFLQFIEMEERTCTIRLTDKDSGKQGVLFFRKGELIGARTEKQNGEKAAYEIFAWDKTSLSIQNDCLQKKRTIHNDLQAIFLDALLIKDEKDDEKNVQEGAAPAGASKREPVDKAPKPKPKKVGRADETPSAENRPIKGVQKDPRVKKTQLKTIPAAIKRAAEDAARGSHRQLQLEEAGPKETPASGGPLPGKTVRQGGLRNLTVKETPEPYGKKVTGNRFPGKTAIRVLPENTRGEVARRPIAHRRAERIRRTVEQKIGKRSGLKNVYPDASWDGLIVEFEKIGSVFSAGRLKVGRVDKGAAVDFILIPGPETVVASVSPNCPRETMMKVLGDA